MYIRRYTLKPKLIFLEEKYYNWFRILRSVLLSRSDQHGFIALFQQWR